MFLTNLRIDLNRVVIGSMVDEEIEYENDERLKYFETHKQRCLTLPS